MQVGKTEDRGDGEEIDMGRDSRSFDQTYPSQVEREVTESINGTPYQTGEQPWLVVKVSLENCTTRGGDHPQLNIRTRDAEGVQARDKRQEPFRSRIRLRSDAP